MSTIYQPKAIELAAWSSIPMEYTVLHRGESHGRQNIGVVIAASLGKDPFDPGQFDYENDRTTHMAVFSAAESISKALLAATEKHNPETKERAAKERLNLMAAFPEHPFQVEEIPNGYCHDWCCINLPWYRVLTRIGWITIGWRKSVINIDWTETVIKRSGSELFPTASFTVSEPTASPRYAHAHGYDKAKWILASVFAAEGYRAVSA